MRFIALTDLKGVVIHANADRITHFHEVPIEIREGLLRQEGVIHAGNKPPTAIGMLGKGKLVVRDSVEEVLEKIRG